MSHGAGNDLVRRASFRASASSLAEGIDTMAQYRAVSEGKMPKQRRQVRRCETGGK